MLWLVASHLSFAEVGFNLIDPTRPAGYQESGDTARIETNEFTLNAIIIHPKHRLAIINHQQVMVGDKIGEFTITSITSNAVELVGPENKKQVLQLVARVKQPR